MNNLVTIFEKAKKYAMKLIQKAIKERDAKGYRENLGYDSDRKLREYICAQNLGTTYGDEHRLFDFFDQQCDKI